MYASALIHLPTLQRNWLRVFRSAGSFSSWPPKKATEVAQFISICRWLKLIRKERLTPLANAPFSPPWARKRCRVAQRFRQY